MDTNKKVQEMVEQGFAPRRISSLLDLNFENTDQLIKSNKWEMTQEEFNDSKIEYIIDLYSKGVAAKVLGKKFRIDKRRVQKWAMNKGILRKKGEANRIHSVNEYIFDNIMTQEQTYWMGFLYADAYNNEEKFFINLCLKASDKEHIVKFINFVGGDIDSLSYREAELGNSYNYKINSKHMSNTLRDLGCMQAKSFIIKYPTWLRPELTFHFIRGLFDGDGCLTFRAKQREYKWSLVSTKEVCESIKEIFYKYDIWINYHCISATGNNTYELETSGNLKIQKIMDLIYQNASSYLQRKYDKYLELKSFNNLRAQRKFDKHIIINNNTMNSAYFKKLDKSEREKLIPDILNFFYNQGIDYPDDHEKVIREYNNLCKFDINTLNSNELDNQSKIGNYICKYFCKSSFYNSHYINTLSVVDAFQDKSLIEKAIINKMNLDSNYIRTANFSTQTIIDELKDLRLVGVVSLFKPIIAKYICSKYSKEGDIVGDYSCGFGARLLGAMSCGRKYLGIDPLTTIELQKMVDFFSFKDVKLINIGSEYYKGEKDSIDLFYSSPPYYDLEKYSESLNQANSKGENYFYNIYWRNTLINVKNMLKPGKWFGVNVNDCHFKMIEIAKEYFGDIKDEIKLVSYRYHFAGEKIKEEKIYFFINNK